MRNGKAFGSCREAVRVDGAYREVAATQGMYRVCMAHNDHFLAWT